MEGPYCYNAYVSHQPSHSAYIHIPFCISKCLYCNFASCTADDALYERCTQATIQEIKTSPYGGDLHTLFFGGGTPSIIGVRRLLSLLDAIKNQFIVSPHAEVSIEVNPATVNLEQLTQLRQSGFNRISIGVQSFDDDMLRRLSRRHSAQQAIQTIRDARTAGFDNINIDLMSALPGQTLDHHHDQLMKALEQDVDHISCYVLSVESDTPLAVQVESGMLDVPDSDLQADMLQHTHELLTNHGYEHYEVSNYCKPGYQCRHNLVYWSSLPYYAFGPAAVSTIDQIRLTREPSPLKYCELMENAQSPICDEEHLSLEEMRFEYLMLALRTSKGFSMSVLSHRYGEWDQLEAICQRLCDRQLLERTAQGYHLTFRGMLIANEVMMEFLP